MLRWGKGRRDTTPVDLARTHHRGGRSARPLVPGRKQTRVAPGRLFQSANPGQLRAPAETRPRIGRVVSGPAVVIRCMIPIHELLNRIRWDPEFARGSFELGYYDRAENRVILVPLKGVSFP